jgi:hypothetical protein
VVAEPLNTDIAPVEVFISYSHKDERMLKKLEAHLRVLKRDNLISSWHDRKIAPGADWENQIDQHMETSDIILLLISADFLDSDYCIDVELKRAMARHEANEARVIPIILRPCHWLRSPFGKLQALPRDGKPVSDWTTQDHAFNEVTRGLMRVVEEMHRSPRPDRNSINLGSQKQSNKSAENPPPHPQESGVYLSNSVAEKLKRMRFLNAVLKSEEDVEDELVSEYRVIQAEMVSVFMPILTQMSKAGLLTVNLNIEDIENIEQYATLFGEPTFVFDNGNIWIDAENSGGVLRKGASRRR